MEHNQLWLTGAGPALRRLRGERPIGEVAKAMGVDTSTLSLIERNKRRLSVAEISSFADAMQQSPREVLKLCLQESLPGFAAQPGSELVREILEALVKELEEVEAE